MAKGILTRANLEKQRDILRAKYPPQNYGQTSAIPDEISAHHNNIIDFQRHHPKEPTWDLTWTINPGHFRY